MLTLRTTATVTKINRKSSSPCFKDLKVGDVIEFSVPIQAVGRSGRYRNTLATYILCHNCRTDVESQLNFNQIEKVLECCELEESNPLYIISPTCPVKVVFDGAYNPKFECTTKIDYYTIKEKKNED